MSQDRAGEPGGVEAALIAVYSVTTIAAGLAWTIGLPLLALWRLRQDGLTPLTAVLLAVGAGWLLLVLFAAVRDRQTRGWILFGLVGGARPA